MDKLTDLVNDLVESVPTADTEVLQNNEELNIEDSFIVPEYIQDEDGTIFDENLHSTDKKGNPLYTKTGKFKKKRVSKKDTESQEIDCNVKSAETVQGIKRGIYSNVLGHEYNDDIHSLYVSSTADYFRDRGGVEISPLATLVVLEISLFCTALKTEKSKSIFSKLKQWFSKKFKKQPVVAPSRGDNA